jgi:hypothetical protein
VALASASSLSWHIDCSYNKLQCVCIEEEKEESCCCRRLKNNMISGWNSGSSIRNHIILFVGGGHLKLLGQKGTMLPLESPEASKR